MEPSKFRELRFISRFITRLEEPIQSDLTQSTDFWSISNDPGYVTRKNLGRKSQLSATSRNRFEFQSILWLENVKVDQDVAKNLRKSCKSRSRQSRRRRMCRNWRIGPECRWRHSDVSAEWIHIRSRFHTRRWNAPAGDATDASLPPDSSAATQESSGGWSRLGDSSAALQQSKLNQVSKRFKLFQSSLGASCSEILQDSSKFFKIL